MRLKLGDVVKIKAGPLVTVIDSLSKESREWGDDAAIDCWWFEESTLHKALIPVAMIAYVCRKETPPI